MGSEIYTLPAPKIRESHLIYRLLNFLGAKNHARDFQYFRDAHDGHFHYYSVGEWEEILAEYGFCDVTVRGFFSSREYLAFETFNIFHDQIPHKTYFRQNFFNLLSKRTLVKSILIWATQVISASMRFGQESPENMTHFFVSGVAKMQGSRLNRTVN